VAIILPFEAGRVKEKITPGRFRG